MSEAYQKASGLLGAREYCRAQLVRKLASFDALAVVQALDRLEREQVLSDERFAQAYVRQRVSGGFGPQKIRYQLVQKGVTGDLADRVLESSEWAWDDWVRRVASRHWALKSQGVCFQSSPAPLRDELLVQVSRFLKQRGFTYAQIELARQFLIEQEPT